MQIKKRHLIIYTIGTLVLILASLAVCFILIPTSSVFAVEIPKSEGDDLVIATDPEKQFLKVRNMAPGDKASAPLTVMNIGKKDFSYDISAEMESGDKLYNYLDLAITDQNDNELYSGKLKDLNGLALGMLTVDNSDIYNVTIGLSSEAGNEYQGIYTSVKFVLNATESQNVEGIVWAPPLDKADVNCRAGDKMPIKFHIESNGDYDIQKRNLELILTGVNAEDEAVQYKFNVSDGSLNWDERALTQPCYTLLFDTGKYPVAIDTYYTATVKDGDQTLGSTRFKSGN